MLLRNCRRVSLKNEDKNSVTLLAQNCKKKKNLFFKRLP